LSLIKSSRTLLGFSGTSITALCIEIDYTVAGSEFATSINDAQNALSGTVMTGVEFGAALLTVGISKVLTSILTAIATINAFTSNFYDYSDNFRAGETIIVQERVDFAGMSRPTYTYTAIIKDINKNTRTKRSMSI